MITDVVLQPDLRLKSGCAVLRVKGILGTRTVSLPVHLRQKTKAPSKAENDNQRGKRQKQVTSQRYVKGKKIWIVKETSLLLLNKWFEQG